MVAKIMSLITFQYSCRIQFFYLNAKVSGNIHTFTNWRTAGQNLSRKLRYNCPPGTRSRATGDVLPRAQRTKCSGFHISFDSHENSPVFQRDKILLLHGNHIVLDRWKFSFRSNRTYDKILSKSRVSAQLYFGPERSSPASKKYGIKTQIGCEILQVRNNLVKTGTFFLIVNLRGKKKKKRNEDV